MKVASPDRGLRDPPRPGDRAAALAGALKVGPGRADALPVLASIGPAGEWFERVRAVFEQRALPSAGAAEEWFLDNAYLVQRVLGRIEEDLPPGFVRRLPLVVAGEQAEVGAPRALALARAARTQLELRIDRDGLVSFVDAWQGVAPLDTSELWALPTLLRLTLLESLALALEELCPQEPAPAGLLRDVRRREALPAEAVVPCAIRSLRVLESLDWKAFFEAQSRIERTLRADPSGDYARLDFETRDRYRKAVEELARSAPEDEFQVAARAVALAAAREAGSRERHVGYFLLDAGLLELERASGARVRSAERARRLLRAHPTGFYLGGVALVTLLALLVPAWILSAAGAGWQWGAIGVLIALLPASALGVRLANALFTRLLPPRRLPRLDLSSGIPPELRTAVVVPTLLGSAEDARHLIRQLELHYLGNPDPELRFVLLTDFPDAAEEHAPGDADVLEHARRGVELLNARYAGGRTGPFHLLHRRRRWNPAEACWMGWERKRGKLEELARWLEGATDTTYRLHVGDPEGLAGLRYIVTLDTDTRLPRGVAARLIGVLAHPLHRAVLDERAGTVTAGYTVVQPRAAIGPDSSARTLFAELYSGDTTIDIYSRAVSDVYQDLFGAGIYVGKGIYDWRAFERCLRGRAPENALASHDLFEGIHGRVALASDLVVYEEYPAHYLAHAQRAQRWIRGDWQLLPWLFPRVPAAGGGRLANRLPAIDRWKIADNLRRSLVPPALLALLVAGWTVLPGPAWAWTALAALAPVASALADLAAGLLRWSRRGPLGPSLAASLHGLGAELGRWLLRLAFLPHEAWISCDAVARTLVRLLVTRRHLLEWRTAAHVTKLFAQRHARASVWVQMAAAPASAVLAGAAVAGARPQALPIALPFLVAWLAAPELARWISRPRRDRREQLRPADVAELRRLARRTWHFYETVVGPEDHWLPPDNLQLEPLGEVAHRTSPTNIGMLLTSTLAAYDLGYVGPAELAFRLRDTLASMRALERHRGHLLNWYDTRTLAPLQPRYVSTVDSGNLAASLMLVEQGCAEIAADPVLRPECWNGAIDVAGLALEDAGGLAMGESAARGRALIDEIERLREHLLAAREAPASWVRSWRETLDEPTHGIEELLVSWMTEQGDGPLLAHLRRVGTWIERLRFQIQALQRDVDSLLAPVALLAQQPPPGCSAEERAGLERVLDPRLALDLIPAACRDAREMVERLSQARARVPDFAAWAERMRAALDHSERDANALCIELLELGVRAGDEADGMDLAALYDPDRRLFFIGHNLSADRFDPHHYDLLASEARLTSYLAVARGDVPVEHWFQLGRPVARVEGESALLSWSATMFEYLMPALWLKAPDDSLLGQSLRVAVKHQIRYAGAHGVPWGISESGYYAFDAEQHYQYRAFGVPGLGFKRGLEQDLVISPYASLMALELAPRSVMKNLARLREAGMMGMHGLYEAADYTGARVPLGQSAGLVRAHMAHHQGMILMALANELARSSMRRRFRSSAVVQTCLPLLYEQVPPGLRPERVSPRTAMMQAPAPHAPIQDVSWEPEAAGGCPEVHVLGNGRLSTLVTDSGAGWLRWRGLALTRWEADTTRDARGLWIYGRDEAGGALFALTRQPGAGAPDARSTRFRPHLAHFERLEQGLDLRLEVAVAPSDDVELRVLSVTDRSGRARRLSFTSAAELALGDPREVERHPAFARLFVAFEARPDERAVVFTRRARAPEDPPIAVVHRLVAEGDAVQLAGWESDRGRFLGRGGRWSAPAALSSGRSEDASTKLEYPLDPLLSLTAAVELPAHGSLRLAFTTAVAESAAAALELSRRYASLASLDWLLQDAAAENARELTRSGLAPEQLPVAQRLLALLLHPHPALRAPAERIAAWGGSQSALWAHGVSGDLPILLLHLAQGDDLELFTQLLCAQRYWRRKGVAVDLVVLAGAASSYDDQVGERLHRVVAALGLELWSKRPGGVHLVRADQVSAADALAFEAAARVVLRARGGGLERLQLGSGRSHDAPGTFAPTRDPAEPYEATAELEPPGERTLENGYGGFTPDGREYVIQLDGDARTPAPWCNVLADESFGCLVSESGLGSTWSLNAGENRLTPWSNDPVTDEPSEVLYLRDEEDGRVWTTTPLPLGGGGACRIHHAAGGTEYHRASHGLRQTMRVFVPRGASLKVVQLELENTWERPRRLTATYFAEWVLGRRRDEDAPHVVPEYDEELGALFARNPWSLDFGGRVAFLAASQAPHGVTADRAEFLGRDGGTDRPAALSRWGLSGRVEAGRDPCAALQLHLELAPRERVEAWFLLGQAEDLERARESIREYRRKSRVDEARRELARFWDATAGAVEIETPERGLDLFVNRWGLYQVVSSRLFGRTAFYQSSGAYGFRDQLQDVLALLHSAPERARAHLLECARHQFEEGDVLHWWHPPRDRGVRTRCSDDLLWLPYVAVRYVEATGDTGVLEEPLPYLTAPLLRADEPQRYGLFEHGGRTESLLAHCRRALERGFTRGAHGLPLMGAGDWNDGMDLVGAEGRGESVWLAWFAAACAAGFARLCERVGEHAEGDGWRARAAELSERVEASAWDGDWYLRAFFDDGTPLGTHDASECRIDSIAQSWAVLSGFGAAERAGRAVDSAERHLVAGEPPIAQLLDPPFDRAEPHPGYIRGYPPGVRENGGQYSHAAAWLAWALVQRGEGERALRVLHAILPGRRATDPAACAIYRVEPYVVAADVYSEGGLRGRGGWTWYTGAAGWTWRLIVEGLLGLRPVDGGLELAPCLPRSWGGARARVRVGRATYVITIEDPGHVGRGVAAVELDGRPLPDARLPRGVEERVHEVRVRLG